jgi:hypothetical protein
MQLPARPCSRPNGAVQRMCRCLPRTAVARMGCCTSLLYRKAAVTKNIVKVVLTLAQTPGEPGSRLRRRLVHKARLAAAARALGEVVGAALRADPVAFH